MTLEYRDTNIDGLFVIKSSVFTDSRGSFVNLFRSNELPTSLWENHSIEQVNLSITDKPGTVRGLHYQTAPYGDMKLVRCLQGKVWDVVVDLRRDSCSFQEWFAIELSPMEYNSILIPEGLAHGFQVLVPFSHLLYLHTSHWKPSHESGIRFDDPSISIPWPLTPCGLSERDLNLPFLTGK